MFRESLCCVAAIVASSSFIPAQTLKAGDPAPALSVAKWVKGDAVESFAEGHVYVVEFWATWCGPCIAGIPHLSAVERDYAEHDVHVIGMTSEDPRNSLEDVEEFVAEQGDAMGYRVAWDDGRKTNDAFMKAAAQRGIPCSFLIDGSGNVAWIGHPYYLELPLGRLIAGDWDPVEGPKQVADVRRRIARLGKLAAGDAEKALADLHALVEEWPPVEEMVAEVHYGLLVSADQSEAAHAIGTKIVERGIHGKDAMGLNSFAWGIVDPEAEPQSRDLDLALLAAEKAVEFSGEKNGAILDTLARVWFWKQDYEKAVEWQEKAVKHDDDESLREVLDQYRRLANGEQR